MAVFVTSSLLMGPTVSRCGKRRPLMCEQMRDKWHVIRHSSRNASVVCVPIVVGSDFAPNVSRVALVLSALLLLGANRDKRRVAAGAEKAVGGGRG